MRLDRRRTNVKGLFQISFFITDKGAAASIATGIWICDAHWLGNVEHAVSPKCPNARAINDHLEKMYFKYSNALRDMNERGALAGKSASEIKRMLTEPAIDPGKPSFKAFMKTYAESRRTENSSAACLYTLKVIDAFDHRDIRFEHITVPWLKDLDAFLQRRGNSINTRAIHFRNLRAVFNSAINEDVVGLEAYPFRKFKIASSRKEKESLSEEQLRALMSYDSGHEIRRIARDLFMLSFYLCGMNLVDLFNLDKLRNGRATYVRTKTSGKNQSQVSILVQPEAEEIIRRYKGRSHVLRFAEELATYETFNNRIQKAVRAIAAELNIEGMTFYWARYTWATLADRLGVAEKEISKGLGHADRSVAGKYYIAYDWAKVDRANRAVIDSVLQKK